MTYNLYFHDKALKEWKKLDNSISKQLKNKLAERLENPKIEKDKLSGYDNLYKIKLRSIGYRLVYEVVENEIKVLVLVVGKREDMEVYKKLRDRTQ